MFYIEQAVNPVCRPSRCADRSDNVVLASDSEKANGLFAGLTYVPTLAPEAFRLLHSVENRLGPY